MNTRRCPRQELNLCTRFRKPLLYPLSYGGPIAQISRAFAKPRFEKFPLPGQGCDSSAQIVRWLASVGKRSTPSPPHTPETACLQGKLGERGISFFEGEKEFVCLYLTLLQLLTANAGGGTKVTPSRWRN